MTSVIHWIEDVFAETALVEARDYSLSARFWLKIETFMEEVFTEIAFAEGGIYI